MPDHSKPFLAWAALFNRHLRKGTGRSHHFPRDRDQDWSAKDFKDRFSVLRGGDRTLNRKTYNDWVAGRTLPKGVNRQILSKLFWPIRLAESAEERSAWEKAFGDAAPPPRVRKLIGSTPPPAHGRAVALVEIVGSISADRAKSMLEIQDEIRRGGHLSVAGALADTFAAAEVTSDAVGEIQVAAAVDAAHGFVAVNRVPELERLLSGLAAGRGAPAPIADGADRRLGPSFIATVLAALDSDPRLGRLSALLEEQGRFAEHRLVECVLDHGRSAGAARSALDELKRFRAANPDDPEVASFLNYRLAIGFRKLGFYSQAAFTAAEVRAGSAAGSRFQSLVLNLRHLDVPQRLYGSGVFHSGLAKDTAALARSFEDLSGVAADAVSPTRVGEAANLSIVASALLGMIQSRAVIGAGSEADALAALPRVFEYGRSVQDVARARAFEGAGASLFRHAYWELSRIAPFALLNGWVEVFDRISNVFTEGFHPADAISDAAHGRFLAEQRGPSAEPNHVQMAMVMAVRRELVGGSGGEVLDALLPNGAPAGVVHNVILGRAWAALQSALGRPLSTALPTHTLPRIETKLLLDCVGLLHPV